MIKDSSIWTDKNDFAAVNRMDNALRTGIVKAVTNDATTGEIRYLVEVLDNGRKVNINCKMLRKLGGVFNYEDTIFHGYRYTDSQTAVNTYTAVAGDAVLVASINGQGRESIILGGLLHPARANSLNVSDGPQYQAEFNGFHTDINSDGEYTITFKGVPTNIGILDTTPSSPLPEPTYNIEVGGSYMKFDMNGGWTINDAAQQDPQGIQIDKTNGIVTIMAGQVSIKITKGSQDITTTTQTYALNSSESIIEKTQNYDLKASGYASLNSPKVAIGTDSIELLEQLNQLITKLSTVQVISPVGLCTPLMATSQWADIQKIQSNINEIKGTIAN